MPGSASPSKPALFARLVKIEHSVYALPFAYAGAFLAADGMPTWAQLVWITVAMVGARSAAMALNRLIDAELDARNPRTATRELPAGRLGRREVWLFTAVSVALLVVAAFQLSEPCRYLWPIPLAAFVLYPYAKRFTWFCHYALGLTLGLAPAAAWLAVRGTLGPVPWLLFFAVGLWVGGFDVIYAIFDLDFDRQSGLHSVPVALGARGALVVAAVSHVATVALLVAVGIAVRPRGRLLDRTRRGHGAAGVAARGHRAARAGPRRHGLHERERRRRPAVRRRRHRGHSVVVTASPAARPGGRLPDTPCGTIRRAGAPEHSPLSRSRWTRRSPSLDTEGDS